jgi:RNA-directed DNA polymerase
MTTGYAELMISEEIIDTAFDWVCERRKNYSHNSDIWNLRWNWETEKRRILTSLLDGSFRLEPMTLYRFSDGPRSVWSAVDALVLKSLTLLLTPLIKEDVSVNCTHVAGNGGLKKTVADINGAFKDYNFVVRSDVKSYYASINHDILLEQLSKIVSNPKLLDLLGQYMRYTTYDGGLYSENRCGLCMGCPLSPILAALYLKPLDDAFLNKNLFYRRYMDDWIILAKTRWHQRKAIKKMNQVLNELKVEKHPDKTEIKRITRGFTFLGYKFTATSLEVAEKTLHNAITKVVRLFEQDATRERIGSYWKKFWGWARSGLPNVIRSMSVLEVLMMLCVGDDGPETAISSAIASLASTLG